MAGLTCISPVISCPGIVIPRKTTFGLRTGENSPQVYPTREKKSDLESDEHSTRQSARPISSETYSRRVFSAGVKLSTGQEKWRSLPVISLKKSSGKGVNRQTMDTCASGVASGVASVSILSGLGCCGGIQGNWLGGWRGFVGGGGSGGGGGGGEHGGNWWASLFNGAMAIAAEEHEGFDSHGLTVDMRVDVSKLNPRKKYKVKGVEVVEMRISVVEPKWRAADSFRCVNVGPNFGLFSRSRRRLPKDEASMTEQQREEMAKEHEEEYKKRVKRAKPCMLPRKVEMEIFGWLRTEIRVTRRMLQRIRERVERWYHEEGYATAQVVYFRHLDTKEVVCDVVEGDITKLQIQFLDSMNSPGEGVTKKQTIERELPEHLKPGYVLDIDAVRKAMDNVHRLNLFSGTEVNPRLDEQCYSAIVVEVNVKEHKQQTAEASTWWPTGWQIVPGSLGRPTLPSILPGGSVTFERRNLFGLNRSISGSVSCASLFNPQDDLDFRSEYVHPYVDGIDDPRNRTFRATCFNSRVHSDVFTGGATHGEVPPIFVDRVGVKLNLTEDFTPQSKFTHGLVVEEVATRDEAGEICTNGARIAPNGAISKMKGPPTTHTDNGVDRVACLRKGTSLGTIPGSSMARLLERGAYFSGIKDWASAASFRFSIAINSR